MIHAAEHDTERVQNLREKFLEALHGKHVTQFVFVDETSPDLTDARRCARAGGSQRTGQGVPLHGAADGDVFAAYPDQVPGPTPPPGAVVVLSNLAAHKATGLAEIAAAHGARLLYLPPCSPDFVPTELAFSKLKTWLQTAQARTREALEAPIRNAIEWTSTKAAEN